MAKVFKFIFQILILISANSLFAQNKIVGYTTNWSDSETQIQFSHLTHLNIAFIFPNADGTLNPIEDTDRLRAIITKAHQQKVKVYISVAGDNLGSENKSDLIWETIAENNIYRKVFVKGLMNFVSSYQLDGVDIFWTYPTSIQASNSYLSLMTDLNKQLTLKGKGLSTVAAPLGEMTKYFPTEVFALVDHINILSYESKDSNSFGYDFAHKSLNYWIMKGLSKEKAIVGIPFHSKHSFNSYGDLIETGASPFDSFHKGDDYNGINQVLSKSELAKNNAGGVMIWEITNDAKDSHSLLFAIHQSKNGTIVSQHIRTLNNIKAIAINHKELLLGNIATVDDIISSNIQDAKIIKRD